MIFLCCTIGLSNCTTEKKQDYFIGEIEYKYSYKSDILNTDSLAKLRAMKSSFRYDNNDYQSRFIGADTITYYYSGKHNKSVSETGQQKNYECEDYSEVTDSVISVNLYDTNEKVLGYSCKVFEMQKQNSWVRYYVSKELKIAPATYRLHRSYNWDEYGKNTDGGLILKSEHRFKHFTMTGIATKVGENNTDFIALELDKVIFERVCK